MTTEFNTIPVLITDRTGPEGLQIADGNSVRVRRRRPRPIVAVGRIIGTRPTLDLTPCADWGAFG